MAGLRRALVFGLAALALAACSANPDANPAPVKLDDLDLKPYADKPCTLLTADQLSEYGIDKPGRPSHTVCWEAPSDPTKMNFAVGVGLGGHSSATPKLKIAGYPASEGSDDTLKTCTVTVYVAATQQLVVTLTGENPCHSAEMVATSAIGTIKQHSP